MSVSVSLFVSVLHSLLTVTEPKKRAREDRLEKKGNTWRTEKMQHARDAIGEYPVDLSMKWVLTGCICWTSLTASFKRLSWKKSFYLYISIFIFMSNV